MSKRVFALLRRAGGCLRIPGARLLLASAQVGPQLRGQSRGAFVPIGHREYALRLPNSLDNGGDVGS